MRTRLLYALPFFVALFAAERALVQAIPTNSDYGLAGQRSSLSNEQRWSIRDEISMDVEESNASFWKWRRHTKHGGDQRDLENQLRKKLPSSFGLLGNPFKGRLGSSKTPKLSSWLREPWIPHANFNATYPIPSVLQHVPLDDELRMLFGTTTWPLRKQDIVYHGPRVSSLDEPAFDQGVLYVISGQGNPEKYILEAAQAIKLLHSYVACRNVSSLVNDDESREDNATILSKAGCSGNRSHRNVGIALVIGFPLERIPEEVQLLCDYIIYDAMSEVVRQAISQKFERQGCIHFCDKIMSLLYTPFDITMYVDCDSRFCSNPSRFFDFMDEKQLDLTFGNEIRELSPMTKTMINSGVMGYRKNQAGARFIYDVLSTYVRFGFLGDQRVFESKLMDRDDYYRYDVFPTRYNYMRCALPRYCIVKGDIVLFHGRIWMYLSRPLCDIINRNLNPRIVFSNLTIVDHTEDLLAPFNRD